MSTLTKQTNLKKKMLQSVSLKEDKLRERMREKSRERRVKTREQTRVQVRKRIKEQKQQLRERRKEQRQPISKLYSWDDCNLLGVEVVAKDQNVDRKKCADDCYNNNDCLAFQYYDRDNSCKHFIRGGRSDFNFDSLKKKNKCYIKK